jgi:tetratricopeptide (TPR) repeat protein
VADTRPRLGPLDGRPGPARPLSPDQARALVHRALGRLVSGEEPAARRRGRGWRRLRQAGIALAGLVLVGSAAAAVGLVVRSSVRDKHAPVAPGRGRAPVVVPAPPAEEVSAPAVEEKAPAAPRRAAPPPSPRRRSQAPRTRVPERASTEAVMEPAGVDELARANGLRAERRWSEAAEAYAAVAARVPGTQDAYVADLARAGLLLERLERPAEALAIYRRAGSTSRWGPLRQEALYGEAACYQVLGNREAERAALEGFLAEFPATPLRAAVERRLADIR